MRVFRLAVLAAIATMAIACSDAPTNSDPESGRGQIGLAPSFSASATLAYQQLAAFGTEVTRVHVRLVAPDGSTRDTSIAFPVTMSELEVELQVPLRTAGQTFRADLELLNSDGVVLFSGSQQVVAQISIGRAGRAPASVQLNYTGPGAGAKSVAVSPATGSILGGASLPVTAIGKDANGGQLADLLVRWTTSDATIATVTPTGNSVATVTSTGKRGSVTISAMTPLGLAGTSVLSVIPTAAKLVVISGSGQTGAAGDSLAQPFVVEVQAVDNLPVPNAPVSFRAVTAGGSVAIAGATADANGRASTRFTLGQIAGAYQYEATSGTAIPAVVSATATASPATKVTFNGGNLQSGVVGTTLPQPLAVKVTNKFGTPVAGAVVNWSSSSGGTPAPTSSTTAADGTASTTYTLSTRSQVEAVRASLAGVTTQGSDVFFSVTALADVPTAMTGTGGGQHAPAGSALPNPLTVSVTDQYGNPVPGYKVTWTVAGGSTATATLAPPISSTDAGGHASSRVTLGNTAGALTVTATAGALDVHFPEIADQAAPPSTSGTLSGFVFDAVTGNPVAGASVSVLLNGLVVATATTNSSGNFTTAVLPAGTYSVAITSTGYTPVSISTLTVSGNTQAPAAPLVPQSTQPGSIAGVVYDATNNRAVGVPVTLELRAGLNSSIGAVLQTVTTNQSAAYTFTNVAAGTYTIVAKAAGYADATKTGISVGGATTSNQDLFISPIGVAGNVRIVLTWRSSPRDLDSYLTGPDGQGGRFLIAYYSLGNCLAAPFACLDNDVTGGNGPETITIAQQLSGTYRYSVNNYSRSPNIDVSGARVDVYINNALAQSFAVPAGNGLTWTVFELNGTVITPINTIGNGPITARIPASGGVAASRIPSGSANVAGSHDDNEKILTGNRAHPKRGETPR